MYYVTLANELLFKMNYTPKYYSYKFIMKLTDYSNVIGLLKLRLMRRITKVSAISFSFLKIVIIISTVYFRWTAQYKGISCFSPKAGS